ncbi:MAG TPA: hypothetical protein VGG34_12405 [Opitutaceae bacterium]|jgi:hypothetical protein
MTDESTPTPRPVSLVAVIWIYVLLSLFAYLADRVYARHLPAAPQNEVPEHLSKDMDWKKTPESRKAYMLGLRQQQAEQGSTYGWVDEKAGVVRLPISRAMELVVQENGGAK